jgi:putative transposase
LLLQDREDPFFRCSTASSVSFSWLIPVDDSTREPIALVAATSLSCARVGRELDTAIVRRGRPLTIVSDKGTEFTSMAILRCLSRQGSNANIAPAKSRQNAFVDSFNGRFRHELLNEMLFWSLDHARELLTN